MKERVFLIDEIEVSYRTWKKENTKLIESNKSIYSFNIALDVEDIEVNAIFTKSYVNRLKFLRERKYILSSIESKKSWYEERIIWVLAENGYFI